MRPRRIPTPSGIGRLDVAPEGLSLTFSPDTKVRPERVVELVRRAPGRFGFLSDRKLRVRLANRPPLEGLSEAKKIVRELEASASRGGGSVQSPMISAGFGRSDSKEYACIFICSC